MAAYEDTRKDLPSNGAYVVYFADAEGIFGIKVELEGTTEPVGSGLSSSPEDTKIAAMNELLLQIEKDNRRIKDLEQLISSLNQILSQPDTLADPQAVTQFKNDLGRAQRSLQFTKKRIVTAEEARAQINAIGVATLTDLGKLTQASKTAAETAQPETPAPTTPPTPAPNNPGSNLNGTASDDSGAAPTGTPGKPPVAPTPDPAAGASGTNATDAGGKTSKPATPAGPYFEFKSSVISTQEVNLTSRPGRRLQNPLGEFSSYTYQITLYMITPDAYTAFVATGRKKINVLNEVGGGNGAGAYVIAQSGGLGSKDKRMPGFDYDYGIDDLSITSLISGKATGSPSQISEINFKITEPYGFSFLSNLRKAGDAMAEYAKSMNSQTAKPENPSREFFILGIRFNGYDASGRTMKPNVKMSSGTGIVDPTSEEGALFEYFIDISISHIKFKIDGRTVVYNVEAYQTQANAGYSTTKGYVKTDTPVEGSVVGQTVDQLLTKLNEEEEKLASGKTPARRYPIRYEAVWLPGTEDIYTASTVSKARIEKNLWPGSGAKTTKESNAAKDANANVANDAAKQEQIAPMPIVQAINELVKRSTFLEDALSVIYTSSPESDPKTKGQPVQKPSYQKKTLSWFNVTPQITDIQWDDIVKDWSYKISYLIEKYDTPVLDSPVVQSGKLYPGPHKRYDYWYTGLNSEIISYEQTMNNAYMMTVVDTGQVTVDPVKKEGNESTASTSTPAQPGMQTEQPRQGSTGYGLEAQNSFLTALYDLEAYAKANITILGDPDWLPSGPVYNEQQVYDQYYGGNGFQINSSGGQVFIEIDFKEAVDYTSQTGTMKINDSIMFWKYPSELTKKDENGNSIIKGVSYSVMSVKSIFSNGAFKQTLECFLNNFGDDKEVQDLRTRIDQRNQQADQALQSAANSGNPGNSTATSGDPAGTPTDKPVDTTTAQPTTPPAKTGDTPATPTTPQGKANDDGKSTNAPPAVPPAR